MSEYNANGSEGFADPIILETVLQGLKGSIHRIIPNLGADTSRIIFDFSERKKEIFKLRKGMAYPYVILGITSIALKPDHLNVKSAARHGINRGFPRARDSLSNYINPGDTDIPLEDRQTSSVPIARLFPMELGITLSYVHNDVLSMLQAATTLAIASSLNAYNFIATYREFKWGVIVVAQPEVTTPEQIISFTDDKNPEAGVIQTQLQVYTKAGIVSNYPEFKGVNITTSFVQGQ